MAYLTSAVLFSLIFSIAYSETMSLGRPINVTYGPYNLMTDATLTVEHNANISICIVAAEFGLPGFTLYSEDICLWFFQLNTSKTNNKTTLDLPLLNMAYTVGVYFTYPDEVAADWNATIGMTLAQKTCGGGEVFDNSTKQCLNVTHLPNMNYTGIVDFLQGETKIFAWNNPNNVGNMEFSYETPHPEEMVLFGRYNAAPSMGHHDGTEDTNGRLKYDAPKPGMWYFSLHALAAGKATITFTGHVCEPLTAGRDCKIPVVDAHDTYFVLNQTVTKTPIFYRILVKPSANITQIASLLVSITAENSTLMPSLNLYASRGQIPNNKTADIRNCNREHCDLVRSIMHNATVAEEWYLQIVAASGNVTTAIWFGEPCIPGCQNDSHGSCQPNGLCECEIDYDGINCAHSKGLGPQYIVLIIIASLVVASAIIGFVAWAYMRQKRGAYEPLT